MLPGSATRTHCARIQTAIASLATRHYNTLMVSMSQTGSAKSVGIIAVVAVLLLGGVGAYLVVRNTSSVTPQASTRKNYSVASLDALKARAEHSKSSDNYVAISRAEEKLKAGDYASAQAALDQLKPNIQGVEVGYWYSVQAAIYGRQGQLSKASGTLTEALGKPEVSRDKDLSDGFRLLISTLDQGRNPYTPKKPTVGDQ